MSFEWITHSYPDELKGPMILAARKALRIRQIDFAQMVGASVNSLWQWESGRRNPRLFVWRHICSLISQMGIKFDSSGKVIDSPTLDIFIPPKPRDSPRCNHFIGRLSVQCKYMQEDDSNYCAIHRPFHVSESSPVA